MKRLIDYYLSLWKTDARRQPLLLRGARQVGKTYSVRTLGKSFESFVEINLETQRELHTIFEKNFDPRRIIRDLEARIKKTITPGKTLFFIDEIQALPDALTALRYFYEELPELHVIAAGSLLDFAIEHVGIPVGRLQSLYMYPVAYMEFLMATGNATLAATIMHDDALSASSHAYALELLGEYMAIGGMPQVVALWADKQKALACAREHAKIIADYQQDFAKYARKLQVKYVNTIFNSIPHQLGKQFKHSAIEGEYRKRELAPALDLLVTANVVHKVTYSAGQGVPLGGQADEQDYKVIFIDIGLNQTMLGADIAAWLSDPNRTFVNQGALVEAFIGQEFLAYGDPYRRQNLYYWHRDVRTSEAEVDYLLQVGSKVVPVEVKSGMGSTLKSLHQFLATHANTPFGLRFCAQQPSEYQQVRTLPLYAVAATFASRDPELKNALAWINPNT